MTHPATLGLALLALALWPHGVWVLQRMQDGSDDPLGLASMALLVALLVKWRTRMARSPHRLAWHAAGTLAVVAALGHAMAYPPLAVALVAALALAVGVGAWLPSDAPRGPLAGLVLLSLPWMASLQFYVGFPLRVVTAELSTWLLQALGMEASRQGAAMTVNHQLVIVDAPCSGVQLAWMAYFAACAVAAVMGVSDRVFWRRLPWVGVLVLAGNALRNAVLVALSARSEGLSHAAHEAYGLMALTLVVGVVVVHFLRGLTPWSSTV